MNDSPNQSSSQELAQKRTDYATFRTREAADRTLMAWIRTSLSLISFGFGIPTIVSAIEKTYVGQAIDPERLSVIIGLLFIAIAMFGLVTAIRSHRRILKRSRGSEETYQDKDYNSTQITAFAMLLIAIVSFVGLIIQALTA